MVHDIFISYASEDKSVADTICANLETKGLQCWIAPRNIAPGEKYAPAIIHAIDTSKIVVVVFSHYSDQSPSIRTEIERAFNQKKVIIPFRIENIEPSDEMQYFIGSRQWLDAFSGPLDEHTNRVADIIKKNLNGETASRKTHERTLSSFDNQITATSAGDSQQKIQHSKFYQIICRSISYSIDFGIGQVIGFCFALLSQLLVMNVIGQENFYHLLYIPNSVTQFNTLGTLMSGILWTSGIIFWFLIIDISTIRSPGKTLVGLKIFWSPEKTNSERWRTIRSLIKTSPVLTMLLVGCLGYPDKNAGNLGILIGMILLIVWFVPIIFTSKSQSIHDLIVGTVVNFG